MGRCSCTLFTLVSMLSGVGRMTERAYSASFRLLHVLPCLAILFRAIFSALVAKDKCKGSSGPISLKERLQNFRAFIMMSFLS